ncbi:hypothetical protein AAT19DRAFT_15921 [Rhodotorula toruloides]|uniref:Pyridoxamine 5'-phosphate oxidase Alr4036 family FMN-binding domain-containing protein n=2 Tax=Rhodotorula toruloides TaxID=5286 RepID=A0A2T0A577_RHOTO|nr:hypothetical protein AAT19DRAFT_15921 [Rhodotorula toruloides]
MLARLEHLAQQLTATTTATMKAQQLPQWVSELRQLVTRNLKENKDLVSYALASKDIDSNQPRVRYVVHRGFVNERRKDGDGSDNRVNDDDGNELISDKLVVTTDARSPKARQLATAPQIELAWWLAATQHQFRIVGRAYILPSPSFSSHPPSASSSASDPTLSSFSFPFLGAKLEPYEGFNWEHERVRQFRRMSPELRASFYRPVPGTTLEKWGRKMEELPQTLPESVEQAENDEQKKQVEEAMKNFALIVIDATEVDLVDLGSMPNKRTRWLCDQSSGEWKEEGLVP